MTSFALCRAIVKLLRRSRRTNDLLDTIITNQEALMGKAEEIKALQQQDITEQQETATAAQGAIDRLTASVTALGEKVAALEVNTVTDEQLAELREASDAAKAQADAVQDAFNQAGL